MGSFDCFANDDGIVVASLPAGRYEIVNSWANANGKNPLRFTTVKGEVELFLRYRSSVRQHYGAKRLDAVSMYRNQFNQIQFRW